MPGIAPSNAYTCADGVDIIIAANADGVFRRLSRAMDRTELADDPRFADHRSRGEHAAELDEHIQGWCGNHKAPDVLTALAEAGVPAGRIYSAPDMISDPHYLARYTHDFASHSIAARGHPPGSVLLLWAFERAGVRDQLTLAIFITALGIATIPLVLYSVRGVCGEQTARRFAPVLVLAPYAIWVAVSMDAVVALLGALMVASGVFASDQKKNASSHQP